MPEVLLSSVCIPKSHLEKLCKKLIEHKIDKIELSGNIRHLPEVQLRKILKRYQDKIRFHIHNYFPAPAEPFVLNLAHPDTVLKSVDHCKKSIILCADLGRKNYSLHAGLAISPRPNDLGKNQTHLKPLAMDESRKILTNACLEVADFAQPKGVRLLLENNVVARFNCPDGINKCYHLSDLEESAHLISLFEHSNIGVLLDTGHLKVSAKTLNFDPIKFIDRFRTFIKVVQISENEGLSDQNLPVKADSWFWPHLPWGQLDYVSLEVAKQPLEILFDQINLTESKINEANGSTIS